MFLVFGVIFLVGPAGAGRVAGFETMGAYGRTEIRAFYGGMEVGLGAFLLAAVWVRSWSCPALWLVALLVGATAAGRAIGFAVEGQATGIHVVYVAIEAGLALAAAGSLPACRRDRQPEHP
jgi:hypothetical protein